MKVIFISINDWANMSYEYVKALNIVGVNAKGFKKVNHHYHYKTEVPIFKNLKHIQQEVMDSDVVLFNHTEYIETGIDLKNKVVGVLHTGSKYRQNSKSMNKLFNPKVDISFCGGDVLGMGAKNEVWIQPVIDISKMEPKYKTDFNEKYIVAHYPSGEKGTNTIISAINKVKNNNFIFKCDKDRVSWDENLKRVSECDIYIEALQSHQNGVPLFLYGVSAIESCALGKVTFARFPIIDKYEKTFGKCGLISVNTEEELTNKMTDILSLPKEQFINLQKESRKWVENFYSYEYIGNLFKNILEKEIEKKRK